jgi:putative oxidoreductase
MKIAVLISRLLLGLVFFVFGLNGFLQFIPMKEMPTGLALQFITALMQSHYVLVVSGTQLLAGFLLLANRYVPFALAILGPVIVNILCYHIFLWTQGIPIAILVAMLWFVLFFYHRQYFSSLFVQKTSK